MRLDDIQGPLALGLKECQERPGDMAWRPACQADRVVGGRFGKRRARPGEVLSNGYAWNLELQNRHCPQQGRDGDTFSPSSGAKFARRRALRGLRPPNAQSRSFEKLRRHDMANPRQDEKMAHAYQNAQET